MDNEKRQMNEATFRQSGEEETAPELMKVRNLLICLPRMDCPAGFEFRLQRRLNGAVDGIRPVRERWGWGMGWAGLGLGFAAALMIAVVAFDFSFKAPQITGTGPAITATVHPQNATTSTPEPNIADTPPQPQVNQQSVALPESDRQLAAAKKDSNTAKNPPTNLPENLYHMVGGNNP